jgi:(1->4)-alpha-D-glucan 1-alpha-D-glucosylmutase
LKRIPVSTYRLQFNKDFSFKSAVDIFDYLKKLGITDIYASPIFHARKGSMHGYDVVEPAEVNPELGSDEEFENFKNSLKKNNFGWLQDIVPNHMAFSGDNLMLIDLLENGPNSRYFNFFDIDWEHHHASIRHRILAPFLGKRYKECLESGEIKLKYKESGFSINYYENILPVKIDAYAIILSYGVNGIVSLLGRENPDSIKYLGILYFLRSLPSAEEIDERYYQIKFVKEILWELYSNNEIIRTSIDNTVEALNGKPGDSSSFDNLDKLLSEQHYRLSYWKVAAEEINYRRFFNINELISLRVELEDVYKRTHSLVKKLVSSGEVTGLRIDHVDGLYNPAAYLRRLNEDFNEAYILVEKILDLNEDLPETWPVEGTTGYEYMNFVNNLFVKRDNEKKMNAVYQRFSKVTYDIEDITLQKKRLIIQARMAGEVERLAFLIESISSRDRAGIDITMHALKGALEEILTYFPVYRTYINRNDFSEQDRKYIDYVIDKVNQTNPKYSNEVNYIGCILKMEFPGHINEMQRELALDFIMKFQQLTGPLMAKGFEDTALYVYNRLISLNEVGGSPGKFGITPGEFHNYIMKRNEKWPHTMNSSSTHDTKRGEDVRARINILSEIPDEWDEKVKLWNKLNKKFKTTVKNINAPERNDEYFLYQSIVGAFPFDETELDDFQNRMKEYIVKAVREAKVHTAWIKPDENYEGAFTSFVESILTQGSEFLNDLKPFQKKINHYGVLNSLSQTIIKLLTPGVPDIYQGSELWNLSMVDPDNRRPVDYDLRDKMLGEIKSIKMNEKIPHLKKMLENPSNGMIKLFFTYELLKERNRNTQLYEAGSYTPLEINGKMHNNLFGFTRERNGDCTIVLTGRFFTEIFPYENQYDNEIWKDSSVNLPNKKFRNILTDEIIEGSEIVRIDHILSTFPFAVLVQNH